MTSKNTLIIGTRGSALALAQADMVCAALSLRYPELDVRREIIHTMAIAARMFLWRMWPAFPAWWTRESSLRNWKPPSGMAELT